MATFDNPSFDSDYQGLANAVADMLNRQDLLTYVPNFIKLGTSRIRRDMARIKHGDGLTTYSYSGVTALQAKYTNLPTDCITPYDLNPVTTTLCLEQITPDEFKQIQSRGWPPQSVNPMTPPYTPPSTSPYYYAFVGRQLGMLPEPSVSTPFEVTLRYYGAVPELSKTATTNWVLTKYPDLYLYGVLVHSAPFLKADERIALWDGLYKQILSDIEIEASMATRQQTKLVAQRRSF